uniref:DUF362 domain-containing protein n=1 Tax=Panagrellus redivivus TaxID=6233 RepID=A0A7E4V975_PANRE
MPYPFERLKYGLRRRLRKLASPAEAYELQIASPNYYGLQPKQTLKPVGVVGVAVDVGILWSMMTGMMITTKLTKSVLPDNGTTATPQEIDHALKALARDTNPFETDCFDISALQTVWNVEAFFKKRLPTLQICGDVSTTMGISAWIYCNLHRPW